MSDSQRTQQPQTERPHWHGTQARPIGALAPVLDTPLAHPHAAAPPASPAANPLSALALFGDMFGHGAAAPRSAAGTGTGSGLTLARTGIGAFASRTGGLFDWLGDGGSGSRGTDAGRPGARSVPAGEASATSAPKKSDQEILDEAVGSSQKNLTKQAWYDSVTKEEAVASMNTMLSLPPQLQGQAIAKLDPQSFGNMLGKVPEAQREQFRALVENTKDPERKLQLWAEYQKSKVGNEAAKDHDKTADEGHWWSASDVQRDNQKKNKDRDNVVKEGKTEIDTEVGFLLEKAKSGKLSDAELSKYMVNKDTENKAELKDLTVRVGTMQGLNEQDRVDYVTKQAEKKLEGSFLFNNVSDKNATAALDTMKALPPDLQGKVVAKMDRGAFDRLIDNVPALKQTDFDSLVQSTHDPERKLLLWGKYHQAKVNKDAAVEKGKTADEGHWWSQNAEQKENKRQNDRRDEITKRLFYSSYLVLTIYELA